MCWQQRAKGPPKSTRPHTATVKPASSALSYKLPSESTCFLLNILLLLQVTTRQRYHEETLLPNLDVPSSMFYALV